MEENLVIFGLSTLSLKISSLMSKSNNYGFPEPYGKSFPHEDDVPRLDHGYGNPASFPLPPPIILPDPRVRQLEKFKITQALLASKHEDGKSICAHVLEMKLHINKLGMLGVDVSGKLAVDLVLQSLPDSYSDFIKDYYMMDHDVTLIDLTYLLIVVESKMIWGTGKGNLTGRSTSQTSMDINNGNIGCPEKSSLPNGNGLAKVKPFDRMVKKKAEYEIVPCAIPKDSVCFYCQEKGHWMRSCLIYLKDREDGRVKMYDSASRSKKRKET
ncbi:hypothetical protein Lser_V15G09280 [Lactuca serriola]